MLQAFLRPLPWIAGIALVTLLAALLAFDAGGARYGVADRALLAGLALLGAAFASLAVAWRATRSPIAEVVDARLATGALVATAAELGDDGALQDGRLVTRLCARRAARALPGGGPATLFPVRAPAFEFVGVLAAVVLLAALLPNLLPALAPFAGSGRSPDPPPGAGAGGRVQGAQAGVRPPLPPTGPGEREPESPAPSGGARSEQAAPPPPTPSPGEAPEPPPPVPQPIDPFVATPKLVPLDPSEGPRSRRAATVLEIAPSDAPGAAAEPRPAPLERRAPPLEDLVRGAEEALAGEGLSESERDFVRRFFRCLRP